MSQVARHVHLHPNYLSSLFQRELGMPVSGYLQKRKLEEAESLLEWGKFSISEIAEMLGYSSTSHFIRAFKKKHGVTPKKMAVSG